MTDLLAIENLRAGYGQAVVLPNMSLRLPEGQVLALLGRNGTGKTTLLKTIMGLTDRMTGTLRLDDRDLSSEPTHIRARSGIAYVPQGREIIPNFSIRENILMGCFAKPDSRRAIPELVPTLFPYLIENLGRQGGLLSGGQQQQLAIARALAAQPRILLLDEPTEGIQPNIVEEIQNIILRLNKEAGLTIVLVEQDVAFARRAADNFLMMEKGRFVASGSADELTEDLIHRHLAV